ncbi:MAG: hypothetical protein HXK95_03575 [Candidatus Nanogingivalaceae bacterium]|nr:MAG: hypothetical protein HXK95_03575 [Candidatus Nanogingivalaceae bacterium]
MVDEEYNKLIKEQNEILLTLQKEGTFEKFYGSLKEKDPYEAERYVPKCDNFDFKGYNDISLREQGTLIVEIADKMKRLKYFTNRTKRQYEYLKSLEGTSDSLHPKILKFIEDYEEYYFREK